MGFVFSCLKLYDIIYLGDFMKSKKENKKKNSPKLIEQDYITFGQFQNLPKILIIVVGIFILFYFLSYYLSNNYKPDNTNKEDTTSIIQYSEILAGETFNQKDSKYYVIFYDSDGNDANLYKYIINSYNQSTNKSLPLYTVDLSNGFNTSYINVTSNKSVQNSVNLKINGPTLIKISNERNILYVEGADSIKKNLK
jgi:predicted RND superfamily exporter protein